MTYRVCYADDQPSSPPLPEPAKRGELLVTAAHSVTDAREWAEQILNGAGKGNRATILTVEPLGDE